MATAQNDQWSAMVPDKEQIRRFRKGLYMAFDLRDAQALDKVIRPLIKRSDHLLIKDEAIGFQLLLKELGAVISLNAGILKITTGDKAVFVNSMNKGKDCWTS